MDEVKRFLRFTLPGMVTVGQLLLAAYVSNRDSVLHLFSSLQSQKDVTGLALAALLSSGALGYVLASIYHSLSWTIFSHSPSITSPPSEI